MANLVTFAKKLWKDKVGGNTPITAAELNRMEGGINDCATQINKLGDSVSRIVYNDMNSVAFGTSSDDGDNVFINFYLSGGKVVSLAINAVDGKLNIMLDGKFVKELK